MSIRPVVLGVALSCCLALAASAAAATDGSMMTRRTRTVIEVYPGPDAIAQALAQAVPGDALNIHAGTYPESLVVSVDRVALRAAGDGPVVVDAGCGARVTIDVRADGVSITGLTVTGADRAFGFEPTEVNFWQVSGGRVEDTVVRDSCDADYGINVFAAGSVTVVGNTASGFGDSGIYVGAIRSTGDVRVLGNRTFGNDRGIIVEDSAGGVVRVEGNRVGNNERSGVYLTASDGVVVARNRVRDNGDSGIELDRYSDANLVGGNAAFGHTADLSDDGGVGNCWQRNAYVTSSGTIAC